jgi:CDP-diacylglycerol--glycerol-3-phosphate 3-phosphatidyltransferase
VLITAVLMIIVLILTVVSGIDYIVAQVRGSRQKA